MHKVEGNVPRGRVTQDYNIAELLQQGSRWCLRLHQPAHVVLHLVLAEDDAGLLLLWEPTEGRKQLWLPFQHVGQGQVMIIDLLADLEAVPGGLGHYWQQSRGLHDVMDRRQHQQRQGALLVMQLFSAVAVYEPVLALLASFNAAQQSGTDHEAPECLPSHVLVEGLALLPIGVILTVVATWPPTQVPVLSKAVDEALAAVQVQAHEPEHGKHGAHGALVLVLASTATGTAGYASVFHIEGELGEGGRDILVEVVARVGLVTNPRRGSPRPDPVGLLASHEPLEERARGGHEAIAGKLLNPRLGRGQPALGGCFHEAGLLVDQ
mmetsp:Transcript_42792/g.99073  ORF Transcript_42792/g.99073 Transcript_42792/m.99073 type:complete len:323 (+) Transcript_42792:949-1917(+)